MKKRLGLLRFEVFFSIIFRQSVKKFSGATKETFTISKAKTLNIPPPKINVATAEKEEKIKNCTCFDNQQHWWKGGGDLSHNFLTICGNKVADTVLYNSFDDCSDHERGKCFWNYTANSVMPHSIVWRIFLRMLRWTLK